MSDIHGRTLFMHGIRSFVRLSRLLRVTCKLNQCNSLLIGHYNPKLSFIALGWLLPLVLLSACEIPGAKIIPLREPPLIPSTPPPTAQQTMGSPQLEMHGANYADKSDIQNFSPNLMQAVEKALRLSVLKPATPESRFEPDRPITYGEFRQWANDYQSAISTAQHQGSATAFSPGSPPPSPAGPMTPPPSLSVTATWLPAEMLWGNHGVREQTTLTREALCALAVFLSGQDSKARKLSPTQIAKAQPSQTQADTDPNDVGNSDGTLDQFPDYAKISPWALRYVALAYQNDWLVSAFNLSSANIIAGDGFQPTQPVSRGEALLLLDQLFGSQPASLKPAASSSQSYPQGSQTGTQNTQTRPGENLNSGASNTNSPNMSTQEQPMPIGRFRSSQENGPSGSRRGMQVNGPD